MLKFYAEDFFYTMKQLELLERTVQWHVQNPSDGIFTDKKAAKDIRYRLDLIEHSCKHARMKRSLERLSEGKLSIVHPDHLPGAAAEYRDLQHELKELRKAIYRDLSEKLFVEIPEPHAQYFDQDELFGADVAARFPEANKEIKAAGNCYATENYTACVFHLMRAVEVVARKLVIALNSRQYLNPPNRPVELCTWDDLLKALDRGVADLAAGTRTNPKKKAAYEFYNHAVAQFRNFKDAWRNNVSHKRETYQQVKTKDIMDNTRQFMQHLATRLKE